MESPDLEPLLRGAANDTERRLLQSAKSVAARPGARDEMLASLGLAASAAPERFVGRVGRLLGSSGGWSVHAVLFALFLGVATSAAVIIGGSSSSPSALPVPSDPPPAVSPSVPALAEHGEPATGDLVSAPPAITPAALPSVPASADVRSASALASPPSKVGGGPAAAPTAGVVTPTDSLGREIAHVEAARAALSRGETARAVELLDAYDREFSHGAFGLEVAVLRIETLARAGQTSRARHLGARFLAEHPDGPFARRVAATVAATPAEGAEPASTSPGE